MAILRLLFACLLLLASTGHAAQPDLLDARQTIEAAHNAIRNDDYRRAENMLEQALLAAPDNADLQHHLGIAYYKSGRHEDALARLDRALELAPGNAEAHYALGVTYLAQASDVNALRIRAIMRNAIQHFESAIEKAPRHVPARFYLAQILINAPAVAGGDKVRAVELNEELKELSPLHHQVFNSTLAAMKGDHEGAEHLLMEIHQKDPDSSLINYSLLSHFHNQQRCQEAIPYGEGFLTAIREWDDSHPADAHLLMAECQRQLGNVEQSLQHYAQALVHRKSEKFVRRVQTAVQEMERESKSERD